MTVPNAPPFALTTSAASHDGTTGADPGPTVLVAEDDENIRNLIIFKLESAGYQAIAVGDGHTALDMISSARPDLIILDVSMPGMDGLSVCHYMHMAAATADIPVIMLSSRSSPADIDLGYVRGADDYLLKPVDPALLLQRVRSLLADDHVATTDGSIRAVG